jgi:prevent-host-death family protein
MGAVPARELRNHTAAVLRRVAAGEEIDVLQDNRPVARIIPLRHRRRWVPGSEIVGELERLGADTTGLREELRELLPDTTEDLRW